MLQFGLRLLVDRRRTEKRERNSKSTVTCRQKPSTESFMRNLTSSSSSSSTDKDSSDTDTEIGDTMRKTTTVWCVAHRARWRVPEMKEWVKNMRNAWMSKWMKNWKKRVNEAGNQWQDRIEVVKCMFSQNGFIEQILGLKEIQQTSKSPKVQKMEIEKRSEQVCEKTLWMIHSPPSIYPFLNISCKSVTDFS